MCEWMYGVVDHCNFRRDVVAVSAAYLDLCLTKGNEVIHSRRSYQLAAMTSSDLNKPLPSLTRLSSFT